MILCCGPETDGGCLSLKTKVSLFTRMDKASAGLEVAEAKNFLKFYTNMMDNHKSSFKYHLSETAVLDWFGKTVKGSRNIGVFLNSSTTSCTHHFTNVKPAAKIGFRDTHVINLPNNNK